MTDLALLAEAHRLIGKFIEQTRGSNGPPSLLGTQIDPSESAEAGELRVSLYGRGGEFKGIVCSPLLSKGQSPTRHRHCCFGSFV